MMQLISSGCASWTIVEHTDRPVCKFKWCLFVSESEHLSVVGWCETESEARAELAKAAMQKVIEW